VTLEDRAEQGFTTDQELDGEPNAPANETTDGVTPDALTDTAAPLQASVVAEPAQDAVILVHEPDLSILDVRPGPGRPHEYHFPRFERITLSNGLTVVHAHVPGRALLAAQLLLRGGGWNEPPDRAGVTVLTGRAMPEGTRTRDANEFVEASERLGAEIHADATWETLSASIEVPKSHFGPALALLAEMVIEPAFPGEEVERLRDERLNDLMQAWSDPRRRSERVFPETIYAPDSPYSRPLGGIRSTIAGLDRDAVVERHAQMVDPANATLVVSGDLTGIDLGHLAEEHLGGMAAPGGSVTPVAREAKAREGRRIVLVDKPGAPQSELRIGHVGVSRLIADFHELSVLNAILGGTFGSRLNRVIREELGYTYGIHSSFDMRRQAGPFVIRTAVETAVTVPAIQETLRIVRDFLAAEVEPDELAAARDYLVGVFPLRFESPAQVAAALGGLIVFELPDDELDQYRPKVAAVTGKDILDAATRHIRPAELSIVIVGDAKAVEAPLRDVGLGEIDLVPADTPAG
jgi:zinc protease